MWVGINDKIKKEEKEEEGGKSERRRREGEDGRGGWGLQAAGGGLGGLGLKMKRNQGRCSRMGNGVERKGRV